MIDEECEVVFLDEAHVKMMDIDDWKILTQGGWTAHDEKYRSSKGFVNKCPILIAAQNDIDFGTQADNNAMDVRLRRYRFRQLPSPDPVAFTWLREHATECIIWAMNHAVGREQTTRPRTHVTPLEHDKLTMDEEQEIYNLNVAFVLESENEEEQTLDDVAKIGSESNSDQTDNVDERIAAEQSMCPVDALRYKQLDEIKRRHLAAKREQAKTFKQRMVALGLLTKDECETFEYQDTIADELKEKISRRRARIRIENDKKKEEMLLEEIDAAFSNPWLARTERELLENKEKFQTKDPDLWRSLWEIAVNKLRLYHTAKSYNEKSEEALARRRRLIRDLGYDAIVNHLWSVPIVLGTTFSDSESDLTGLTQPDPVRKMADNETNEEDANMFEIFQTPSASRSTTTTATKKRGAYSEPSQQSGKTRKRDEGSKVYGGQPVVKRRKCEKSKGTRRQTTIGDYFSQN